MGSLDSNYDRTMLGNSDGKTEFFPVETSENIMLGSFDSTTLGVAGSSKLGEELVSKEAATLGVSE